MVVFSNHRLGPSAELFVSDEAAVQMLRETAMAARPFAKARWEVELVWWLDGCAEAGARSLDVADFAWTPEHFETQRRFVVDAIQRAAAGGIHAVAFERWRRMVEAHPADCIQASRRWQWAAQSAG